MNEQTEKSYMLKKEYALQYPSYNIGIDYLESYKALTSVKTIWEMVAANPRHWEEVTKEETLPVWINGEEPESIQSELEREAEKYAKELIKSGAIKAHQETWMQEVFKYVAQSESARKYHTQNTISVEHARKIFNEGFALGTVMQNEDPTNKQFDEHFNNLINHGK